MKKTIASSLCSALLLTSLGTSSAFAAENTTTSNLENKQSIPSELFEYNLNGIPFSNPEPLTDQHIQKIYSLVNPTLKNKENSSIQYGPANPGDSGIIVDGPFYKTYSNKDVRFVVSAVSWLIAERFGLSKIASGALAGGTFWASEMIGPTYVGTWSYKVWDDKANKYRLYVTVVHYKYGNYTSPIRVSSRPVGWL